MIDNRIALASLLNAASPLFNNNTNNNNNNPSRQRRTINSLEDVLHLCQQSHTNAVQYMSECRNEFAANKNNNNNNNKLNRAASVDDVVSSSIKSNNNNKNTSSSPSLLTATSGIASTSADHDDALLRIKFRCDGTDCAAHTWEREHATLLDVVQFLHSELPETRGKQYALLDVSSKKVLYKSKTHNTNNSTPNADSNTSISSELSTSGSPPLSFPDIPLHVLFPSRTSALVVISWVIHNNNDNNNGIPHTVEGQEDEVEGQGSNSWWGTASSILSYINPLGSASSISRHGSLRKENSKSSARSEDSAS